MSTLQTIGGRCHGHDNNFNLIRLIAALAVLVSHSYPVTFGNYALEPVAPYLQNLTLGGVGVVVFFAISGFFIARSFDRNPSLISYLSARALRIFPALAVMLSATVLAGSFLTSASWQEYWSAVPRYMTATVSLSIFDYYQVLPGLFDANPYPGDTNASLWTLQFEVYFYLCVAVIGLLGLFRRPMRFAAFVAGFFLLYGLMIYHGANDRMPRLGFPFALGMCFWVWRDRVRLSPVYALALLALVVLLHPSRLFFPSLTIFLTYATFVLGFARLPLVAGFNRLGDYSYGAYIYAFPIQQGVASFGVTSPLINIAVALPLTMCCAVLSWYLVERPALSFKRPVAARPSGAISGA